MLYTKIRSELKCENFRGGRIWKCRRGVCKSIHTRYPTKNSQKSALCTICHMNWLELTFEKLHSRVLITNIARAEWSSILRGLLYTCTEYILANMYCLYILYSIYVYNTYLRAIVYIYCIRIYCIHILHTYIVYTYCIHILYTYMVYTYCIHILYTYIVYIYWIHILYTHIVYTYCICILHTYIVYTNCIHIVYPHMVYIYCIHILYTHIVYTYWIYTSKYILYGYIVYIPANTARAEWSSWHCSTVNSKVIVFGEYSSELTLENALLYSKYASTECSSWRCAKIHISIVISCMGWLRSVGSIKL